MKHMVGQLGPVLILVVGLFLLADRLGPGAEPEDVVDLFVNAGIEFATSPVEAELLEQRKIVIGTDINGITTQRVIRALLLLEARDSRRPIELYIRTEGGWIDDAFSIINVMQNLKSPVNTHAIGGTHSSGAMILAAGTGVRYAYPYSSIMFHGGLCDEDSGRDEDRIDSQRLAAFWEQRARLPSEWLHSREEKTCFLGAEEALKLGLVDQILTARPNPDGQPSVIGK